MSLAQLVSFPRHLLAATIERGGERFPVKVERLGAGHLVVSGSPLRQGERARVVISSPLSAHACHVTAEAVGAGRNQVLLSIVA
jgi:hypothetical protein